MHLTPAQKTALRNHINANTTTVVTPQGTIQIKDVPKTQDTYAEVTTFYNTFGGVGTHTTWKSNVLLKDIAVKINGTELAGLTTANHTRLQTVVVLINAAGGANPSVTDQRAFWDDIFSGAGGVTTRASLLALWKRLCRNWEKILYTGTGSDASPLTPVLDANGSYLDGNISVQELVEAATFTG